MTPGSHEVHLAIYDLSHGMARTLSAQFLGPQLSIEIIPHTGIVAFGQEYFFGTGVQRENPTLFRQASGLAPMQLQYLGRTTVSQAEFEAWCSSNGVYTATSYDLLHRNCNNFSHDAALQGLRLTQGVPEWILQVPQRFLSSPFGQMVRPMLENMQLTAVDGSQPLGIGDSSSLSSLNASSSPAATQANDSNPWAALSNSSTEKTNISIQATKTAGRRIATPLLDSYTKPMFSNETKTVDICLKKIKADSSVAGDLSIMDKFPKDLKEERWTLEVSKRYCDALLHIFQNSQSSVVMYACMLFRLVLLRVVGDEESYNEMVQPCLDCVDAFVNDEKEAAGVRSMAWLCLANAIGKKVRSTSVSEERLEQATACVAASAQNPSAVRQAASAWLYNATFVGCAPNETDEMNDWQVALLCASLEEIDEEEDPIVLERRLMTVGRIIRPADTVHAAAIQLVRDLDLAEALSAVRNKKELAKEILSLID